MSTPDQHDPLASARGMQDQMKSWKAEAVQNAKAETEEPETEELAAPAVSAGMMTAADAELAAGLAGSALTVRVKPGLKHPIGYGWNHQPGLTPEAACAHVAGGGNIGVDPGRSRMVVMDAENAAGVEWLLSMGFTLTVVPAKSGAGPVLATGEANDKEHGGHVWLRLADGAPEVLGDTRSMIHLKNGGKLEIFASGEERHVVAPPSRLDEAYGLSYAFTGSDITEAPAWLWDRSVPVPEAMDPYDAAQVHGAVAPPTPRERAERSAESQELSDAIVAIPWAEWIAGDPRIEVLDSVGSCGCNHFHFVGQSSPNAGFLHECDDHDGKAHLFSTTAMAELGLEWAHVSRLDFALGLRNSAKGLIGEPITRAQLMREYDLITAVERDLPGSLTAGDYEADADALEAHAAAGGTNMLGGPGTVGADVVYVDVGADGLLQRAKRCRQAAAVMGTGQAFHRARKQRDDGETFISEPMIGMEKVDAQQGPDHTPPQGSEAEATEARPAVVQLDGLPPVHPDMALYRSHAATEMAGAAPPINTDNHAARYLIPMDTRSLLEAVTGPRACQAPVDVEATHGQVAEAVAAAVGGTKLRRAGDLDQWYGWDGIRWEINRDAAQVAVQSLINRHRQSADPVVQQRRIRAYIWKKPTNEIKAKYVQALGYKIDGATSALMAPDGAVVEMVPVSADKEAEAAPFQKGAIAQLGACPEVATRTGEFDVDPAVLGTPGGYIVLGRGGITTMPPDPRLMISKLTTAGYDPTATAPLFEEAMKNALPDDEVRGFLQRVTGQALFGEQEHHTLLNLRGTGGNGKGLYQDIIEAILGEYAVKLQASVLTLAGANNHSTDVLPLRGARLAFVNEVPPQQLNIDLLKELTGGGTKTARGIAKDPVTWKQSHTLILSSNNQLTWAPSAFRAMSRRLLEVRFEQEFGTEGGLAAVHGLADRIIREEASGALNWCLQGYLDYVARGRQLDPPAKVQEWTKATLTQSSSWSAFCAGMFTVTRDKADEVTVAEVFALWTRFRAGDTDQKHASPSSSRVVGKMLAEQLAGVTAVGRTSSKAAHVVGLKWSDEAETFRHDAEATVFVTANLGRDPWDSNWDKSGWNTTTPSAGVPPIGTPR